MTQEELQLLIKDLCERLPYGVILHVEDDSGNIIDEKLNSIDLLFNEINVEYHLFTDVIQPYLRPMSSMTEEEENEYRAINCYEGLFPRNEEALDYVLEHHFDYRGLIEKGLALEASEGMYK